MKLHWKALSAEQREVLEACAKPTARWNAYLAGRTALALQFGHRRSEDLDWFTPETLDPEQLLADAEAMGFPIEVVPNEVGTFLAKVGGVKFSVFRYRYAILDSFVVADGAKLAALRDLAAMKLAASALDMSPAGREHVRTREACPSRPLPGLIPCALTRRPLGEEHPAGSSW